VHSADLSESQVDEVGEKLSTSDEETVESYKGSPNFGGGSLRNVERRCHWSHSNTKANKNSTYDENSRDRCCSHYCWPNYKEDISYKDWFSSSKSVVHPSTHCSTYYCSSNCCTHYRFLIYFFKSTTQYILKELWFEHKVCHNQAITIWLVLHEHALLIIQINTERKPCTVSQFLTSSSLTHYNIFDELVLLQTQNIERKMFCIIPMIINERNLWRKTNFHHLKNLSDARLSKYYQLI